MKCRICDSDQIEEVIVLNNVPESAQLFVNKKEEVVNDKINLEICQCMKCGHVQSGSGPVSYYKEVITAAGLSPKISQERISVIKNIVFNNKIENPNILEIGSCKGLMVERISKELSYKVTGLEGSLEAVKEARSNNINIVHGYLGEGDINLGEEKFNIVVCYNFLEHMPEPSKVLETLKDYLSETAYIYMTVPSLNFIEETSCVHEFISDHLSYFNKNSLKYLFEYCNYENVSCNSIHNNNDLEITASYKQKNKLSINLKSYFNLIDSFNKILDKSKENSSPVFVWGAGHRSLTLISQLEFANIEAIIDSANFKQGKYAPATRIKIMSPQYLEGKRNGTLIINLPGIYGEEVISSLGSNIRNNLDCIYNVVENEIIPIK